MTAEAPVTLVWAAPEAPDGGEARALASWARAHGVRMELPRTQSPRALPLDPNLEGRVSDEVERLLDRVRDGVAARDVDAADRALALAESTLRAHPELPQAAWLMAEVERARASRFRRLAPLDDEAADRAWVRAEALDGGRLPGVGERAAAAHPADAAVTLEPFAAPRVARLDGRAADTAGGTLTTHAGLHAVVLTWNAVPVWASWVDVPPGISTLHVGVDPVAPCSSDDVAGARVMAGGVAAETVRCGAWVLALPGRRASSVLIATCEAAKCGALLEWAAPGPTSWAWTPPTEGRAASWPSWATWGLVGAGAAIATGVVLVAAGALQSTPSETRFVSGGIRIQ